MRVLQDGLGSGFPCTVPTAGVHPDHQRLALLRAAANRKLQGGAVLQGVQRHHTVVMIRRQKQHGWVWRARIRRLRQVVERRIPEGKNQMKGKDLIKEKKKLKRDIHTLCWRFKAYAGD